MKKMKFVSAFVYKKNKMENVRVNTGHPDGYVAGGFPPFGTAIVLRCSTDPPPHSLTPCDIITWMESSSMMWQILKTLIKFN
jgi:hypothetical protein